MNEFDGNFELVFRYRVYEWTNCAVDQGPARADNSGPGCWILYFVHFCVARFCCGVYIDRRCLGLAMAVWVNAGRIHGCGWIGFKYRWVWGWWGARKKTGTPTFNSKATLTTCPSDRMKLDKTSNERHNTVSACVCVKAKLHHFTDGVNRGGQYLRF